MCMYILYDLQYQSQCIQITCIFGISCMYRTLLGIPKLPTGWLDGPQNSRAKFPCSLVTVRDLL